VFGRTIQYRFAAFVKRQEMGKFRFNKVYYDCYFSECQEKIPKKNKFSQNFFSYSQTNVVFT
jgi:hypothetical protein